MITNAILPEDYLRMKNDTMAPFGKNENAMVLWKNIKSRMEEIESGGCYTGSKMDMGLLEFALCIGSEI